MPKMHTNTINVYTYVYEKKKVNKFVDIIDTYGTQTQSSRVNATDQS